MKLVFSLQSTGQALLLTLNPISGVPTDDMPPGGLVQNYAILQMSLMPFMDEHFLRPLVILDQQLKVSCLLCNICFQSCSFWLPSCSPWR